MISGLRMSSSSFGDTYLGPYVLRNFAVEMSNDEGQWIRGIVIDRLDRDHVLVDFQCSSDRFRRVPNTELFLVSSERTRNMTDLHPGNEVYVLAQLPSKCHPVTWYPGKVVFEKLHPIFSIGHPRTESKPHWIRVETEFTPQRHVELFKTQTLESMDKVISTFQFQQAERHEVTGQHFAKYHLKIPTSVSLLRSRMTDPTLFRLWLTSITLSEILILTEDAVTLLRKCHDDSIANGSFWDEFGTYLANPKAYEMKNRAYSGLVRNRDRYERHEVHDTSVPQPCADATHPESSAGLRKNVFDDVPDELLLLIFGLVEVDQQETLSKVDVRWRSLISTCRYQKVIFSVPLCKCHHVWYFAEQHMIRCASRFIVPGTKTVIIRAYWDDADNCPTDLINLMDFDKFPVHDLLRYLDYRGICLENLVLADARVHIPLLLGPELATAVVSNITHRLIFRHADLVMHVRVPDENVGIETGPLNGVIRFGVGENHVEEILTYLSGLWPPTNKQQKEILRTTFANQQTWSYWRRYYVRSWLEWYEKDVPMPQDPDGVLDIDLSKLKSYSAAALCAMFLLSESAT